MKIALNQIIYVITFKRTLDHAGANEHVLHDDCAHVVAHPCLCLSVNVSQNTAHQCVTAPRPGPAIYGPHASC